MKFKRLLSVVLIMILIVSAVPFVGITASAAVQGDYYYTVTNGEAQITGVVNPIFFQTTTIPAELGGYPVTSIGAGAFQECSSINRLTIPQGVKSIGTRAFARCSNLKSIVIPEGVTEILEYTFQNCLILESVTVPDSILSISETAFEGAPLYTLYYAHTHTYSNACDAVCNGANCEEIREVGEHIYDDNTDAECNECGDIRYVLAITKEPADTYTKSGATAKTTVTAVGNGLTYTWYIKNSGATKYSKSSITTNTYSVKMSNTVKDRRIYCVIKDKYGNTVQTNTVILRMAASITTQPKTTYTKSGATVKTTVKAAGDGLKYTWYIKNSGATKYSKSSITTNTYSVKMSSTVKDRRIYCVIKDKYGNTVQTNTVILRMVASITTQPKSVKVAYNKTAKVTLKAAGDGLKYTWYIKNKGASKYTKSSVTKSTYSVTMSSKVNGRLLYCVVKDKYGKTVKSTTVSIKKK